MYSECKAANFATSSHRYVFIPYREITMSHAKLLLYKYVSKMHENAKFSSATPCCNYFVIFRA